MAIVKPSAARLLRFGSRGADGGAAAAASAPGMPALTAPAAESFRLLALNLRTMLEATPNKAFAVMSALPADGRTLVATQVAASLAEHRPTLFAPAFDVRRSPELVPEAYLKSNGLGAHHGVGSVTVRQWILLGSESGKPEARDAREIMTLVGASQSDLAEITKTASSRGMFTVIDTTPATSSSDAFIVASEVGQVVYVVRDRPQQMAIHQEVRGHLVRLGVTVLGVVVNAH